ncbi:MAG: response regulator [Bacteroidales bacterium]
MKVLIAEDDIDFGNILSQYVTISGFEVILARNGLRKHGRDTRVSLTSVYWM